MVPRRTSASSGYRGWWWDWRYCTSWRDGRGISDGPRRRTDLADAMDPRQLAGLATSAGSVAFAPATPSYEVEVGHDVESATVPPTGNESEASVRVKGRRWRAGRRARPFR